MSRIAETFARLKREGRKALIPFLTAGDPDLDTTERLLHLLVEEGADVIELGIPFSDPMADGPTIQEASLRALESGTTLAGVLQTVERVRQHTNTPIVLMGYYNPVLRFGPERFAERAAEAGVDGLLLVDLPPEEAGELQPYLQQRQIDLVTLLAPTTPAERRRQLAAGAEGYLYYVSMTGVTGSRQIDPTAIAVEVEEIRGFSRVPVAVGFGITSPGDAAAVARFADGVVVGSALVKIIGEHGASPDLAEKVAAFVRALREGIDGV
ncbi:tryptophan synthase alpha chain [Geothermobacter ehrlichii]|uniref:Tryptophan synthase alpha chain n=1 Tax=Geothermobacter ehrlichii TaxID=213224 RepID=A0A5D3WGI8_9BACT|nr:tryptophan synthase subunit alpha [Geothermobacter ehrlichii]TYO95694.1 tryptophan synthase alpha chain [Geothermobacter ehrlichii]